MVTRVWRDASRRNRSILAVLLAVLLALALTVALESRPNPVKAVKAANAAAVKLPPHFSERTVLSGLDAPMTVQFSRDGRVFVGEKSGIIKVFDGLNDRTPVIYADLRPQVFNYLDRGLIGLALHPRFPEDPRVFVYYIYNGVIGGPQGKYPKLNAAQEDCPPGQYPSGCLAAARVSSLTAPQAGAYTEKVLVEDWCQQTAAHYGGALGFGKDGKLYVGGGDAASYSFIDFGQDKNLCGDPPGPAGTALTAPTAEGGSLRSQDLRTLGDPVGLDGTLIRIDPDTGAPAQKNPVGGQLNHQRIVAYGLRMAFRMAVRPGTNEIYLADVGGNGNTAFEEINRVVPPFGGKRPNFGWPCYGGGVRAPGYEAAGLNLCKNLYAEGAGAVTKPYFQYRHDQKVGLPSLCPVGSNAAITSIGFYDKGAYPAWYRGAIFFGDPARGCIWWGKPGPGGVTGLKVFASRIGRQIVDLRPGPGGDLFTVDHAGGQAGRGAIVRYSYTAGNTPPTAVIAANVTAGRLPLTVRFDGRGSSDPNPGGLKYAWDLDGDGQFDDSKAIAPVRKYTKKARINVRLRVTDPKGAYNVATTRVTPGFSAPKVTITAPAPGTKWAVGDKINYAATVTDAEQGTVPNAKVNWQYIMHHCPGGACHEHVLTGKNGKTGIYEAVDHEYPSWVELRVTATDRDGLKTTKSRRLDAKLVELTLASDPAGLKLAVGDHVAPAPYKQPAIIGSKITLSAPQPQFLQDKMWQFSSWSDGFGASHNIPVPGVSTTYTATFVPQPNLALGKAVTASSDTGPGFTATSVTDGKTGTRWSSAYRDKQWVQVDLGVRRLVGRAVLRWQEAAAKGYTIQLSDDGKRWRTVYATKAGNGGTDMVGFAPEAARYVRMSGTDRASRYGFSLWEFEVYNR